MNNEIELGDKVKDLVTGFEGITVAKSIFLNGCVQFLVSPVLKKNNQSMVEIKEMGVSIDSQSLCIVEKNYIGKQRDKLQPKAKVKKKSTGGPNLFMSSRSRGF